MVAGNWAYVPVSFRETNMDISPLASLKIKVYSCPLFVFKAISDQTFFAFLLRVTYLARDSPLNFVISVILEDTNLRHKF